MLTFCESAPTTDTDRYLVVVSAGDFNMYKDDKTAPPRIQEQKRSDHSGPNSFTPHEGAIVKWLPTPEQLMSHKLKPCLSTNFILNFQDIKSDKEIKILQFIFNFSILHTQTGGINNDDG